MLQNKLLIVLPVFAIIVSLCSCSDFSQIGGSIFGGQDSHEHSYYDASCTTPKTCKICGETLGEAKGHSWMEADCYNPKTCSVCYETVGEKADHDWRSATQTAPKTCSRCGESDGDPLGGQEDNNYHGHVYTGGTGSTRYHYEPNCAGKYSHEITWEEVYSKNLAPCGTCVDK